MIDAVSGECYTKILNAKYNMQYIKYKLQHVKYELRNTKYNAVKCMQIIDALSGKRLNQNCPINTHHRAWPDSKHVTN